MAKSGATLRWGVEAEPTLGARCSSSPRMQPRDHMSTALVYPPLDMTTCRSGRQECVTIFCYLIYSVSISSYTSLFPTCRSTSYSRGHYQDLTERGLAAHSVQAC